MDLKTARAKWKPEIFSNMLRKAKETGRKEDMYKAFAYREKILGKPIPKEWLLEEKEEKEEMSSNIDSNNDDMTHVEEEKGTNAPEQEKTMSRDEMKAKLEENNIEYSKNAKTEFLLKKLIENNLV